LAQAILAEGPPPTHPPRDMSPAPEEAGSAEGGKPEGKKKRKRAQAPEVAEEAAPGVAEGKKKRKRVQEATAGEAEGAPAEADSWWAEHGVKVEGAGAAGLVPAKAFSGAGFPKRLTKACQGKFPTPTPVQAASWPLLMAGRDVVGIAKTGSGKTLCFALPFLARSELGELEIHEQPCHYPRMVVLAPTRELTQQIATVVTEFAVLATKTAGRYPVCTIVGGVPKGDQFRQIREQGCDIVCGTTGRLCDLVGSDRPALDLSSVKLLVLDEADRMLDMGFIDDVKRIAGWCPKDRQTMLFSATWPSAVHKLASSLTRAEETATIRVGAVRGEGDAEGPMAGEGQPTANEMIKQTVEVLSSGREKFARLTDILWKNKGKKVLVFGLYKKEVASVERQLQQRGFPDVVALQGDMTQAARNQAMDAFRKGTTKLMVATDVAARGLDVPDIDIVVNYTFPLTIEDFVHRIGRTGRAGKSGVAWTLFNGGPAEGVQDEKAHAGDLVRVLLGAKQQVPPELEKIAGTSGGNKATKKKAHALYGNFFKDEAEMAKLMEKKTKVVFADSDDE